MKCRYCGKSAGFLRFSHWECKQRHQKGRDDILALVRKVGFEGGNFKQLEASVKRIAAASYIDQNTLRSLLIEGWEQAVDSAFADDLLSEQEEHALIQLMKYFSLPEDTLYQKGSLDKVVKGAILRDVMTGDVQQRMDTNHGLPFNLQKSEQLVWVFHNTDYYEVKTRSQFVGGSQGVSVRIARGVYYRTGGFRGERVQSSETIHADTGLLGVTTKHLYFAGDEKRFRIPYKKIVTFEPFADGIGIQKDAQRAKPQSFTTGDGWFTYNLITNLARL